jgi:hypothetical protein
MQVPAEMDQRTAEGWGESEAVVPLALCLGPPHAVECKLATFELTAEANVHSHLAVIRVWLQARSRKLSAAAAAVMFAAIRRRSHTPGCRQGKLNT